MNTTSTPTEDIEDFTPAELAAALAQIKRNQKAHADLRTIATAAIAPVTAYDAGYPHETEPEFVIWYTGRQKHLAQIELTDRESGERHSVMITNGPNWLPERLMPEGGSFIGAEADPRAHAGSVRMLAKYEEAGDLEILAPGPSQTEQLARLIRRADQTKPDGLMFGCAAFTSHAECAYVLLSALGFDSRSDAAELLRAKLQKAKARASEIAKDLKDFKPAGRS